MWYVLLNMSFFHSFIQQLFPKHLLHVKAGLNIAQMWSRLVLFITLWGRQAPHPTGAVGVVKEMEKNFL